METQKAKLREVLPPDVPEARLDELLAKSQGNLQIAVALYYDTPPPQPPRPANRPPPPSAANPAAAPRAAPAYPAEAAPAAAIPTAIPVHNPSQPYPTAIPFSQPYSGAIPTSHAVPLETSSSSPPPPYHSATPSPAPQAQTPPPPSTKAPKDAEYYDVLEIPYTATPAEIKKSYYKAAMKCHPDKHPDDPHAEEKFKKVSEAYQVLSDPALKAKYDQYGKEATQGSAGNMDPKEFFNKIFGGGKFEEFIGELSLLSMTNENMTDEMRERAREARIAHLSSLMVMRIQPFVDGNSMEFERRMTALAEELKEESFGYELLQALGYIYAQKSKQFLGESKFLGLKGIYHGTREKIHLVSETISAVSAAMDLQNTAEQAQKNEEAGFIDQDQKERLEKDMAMKGIHTMWRLNKLDIETTIRGVCDRVMRDPTANRIIQTKRAEALRTLGRVFVAVKGQPTPLSNFL